MQIEIKGNLGYYITVAALCFGVAIGHGTPLDLAFFERFLAIEGLMFTYLVAAEFVMSCGKILWDIFIDVGVTP